MMRDVVCRDEVIELIEQALNERGIRPRPEDDNRPDMIIPIKPFRAVGSDDNPIEVIGVGYNNEMMQFLCIIEEDGEVWPSFREEVYREATQ